jgi:electron transfer flavoprotein alpha/beta subunit
VPTEVARLLDVQQFCYTDSLTIEGDCFVAVQDYGDTRRACRVPKGSVISFSSLDLRGALPTARGYMDSLGKEIITLDRVALGLGLYSVGGKGSPTRIVSTSGSTSVRRNRKVDISNPATASDLLIREIGGIE